MKDLFHEGAGEIFQYRGDQRTAKEQEKRRSGQVRQKNGKQHCCKTINGTEGAVYKTSVYKFPADRSQMRRPRDPSGQGIDEKEPYKIEPCVRHESSPLVSKV